MVSVIFFVTVKYVNLDFFILGDLQEIQHLTEKSLYNQRQKLLIDHKGTVCAILCDIALVINTFGSGLLLSARPT